MLQSEHCAKNLSTGPGPAPAPPLRNCVSLGEPLSFFLSFPYVKWKGHLTLECFEDQLKAQNWALEAYSSLHSRKAHY